MSLLSNKWILITGASRGVGRQLALGLAEHGGRLLLHSRRIEHTRELARVLAARDVEVHRFAAELAEPDDVERLIDDVLTLTGGVDVLYNNAAIMTPWRTPHTAPSEDYRISFQVNVTALVRLCDRLLPPMTRRGWGRIVNVTSGIANTPELMPYSMSKAAVDRYVRDISPSLAGTGVIMSLMDPGWLRTDLGGPNAPNPVESCMPGMLVPLLLPDDAPSGQFFNAQHHRTDG